MNKNQSSGVDINTPMITREEYLNARRQAMIDAAYLNSLNRKLPAVPMIANPDSIEVFEDIKQRDIANAQEYLARDPNNPAYQSWLESAKNMRYDPLVPGASCIYTFTDNYGTKYLCPSNYKFKNMSDSERGFIQIPVSDMKPGDGMMHGTAHMIQKQTTILTFLMIRTVVMMSCQYARNENYTETLHRIHITLDEDLLETKKIMIGEIKNMMNIAKTM